jgi:hypothetical protein
MKHVIVGVGVGLLLMAGQVRAHHAFSSEFDVKKPLTLKGTITKWEMINPHSWFHLDVKEPDGNTVEWMIEGGSPNTLIRQGVTKNTVKIGMELTVEAYEAKDATHKAVGRNFVLPDGRRLFVGSQSNPDAPSGGAEYPRGRYGDSLKQVAQLIKSDLERWAATVKASGFKPLD